MMITADEWVIMKISKWKKNHLILYSFNSEFYKINAWWIRLIYFHWISPGFAASFCHPAVKQKSNHCLMQICDTKPLIFTVKSKPQKTTMLNIKSVFRQKRSCFYMLLFQSRNSNFLVHNTNILFLNILYRKSLLYHPWNPLKS